MQNDTAKLNTRDISKEQQDSLQPAEISISSGALLASFIAEQIRLFRADDPLSRITVVAPSFYSKFFLRRAVTNLICAGDADADVANNSNGSRLALFNIEFLRIEDVADLLFETVANNINKTLLSRLIASELIYDAMSNLKSSGPLKEHAQNESATGAVHRTLQELELLETGTEDALNKLANVSDSGIYPQLLEIQREYSKVASNYISGKDVAATAGQVLIDDAATVASILGARQIVVVTHKKPDVFTKLWECLTRLDTATTVKLLTSDDLNSEARRAGSDETVTHFYSTLNAADEPRALIRNIMEDARGGVRFGDMAVIVPSGYEKRIQDSLRAADIPITGRKSRSLADSPQSRFVVHLLKMINSEMRPAAFATWATGCPIVEPATGERIPAARWEKICREVKLRSLNSESDYKRLIAKYRDSMFRKAKRVEEDPDMDHAISVASLRTEADLANRLIRFLDELNEQLEHPEHADWGTYADWLLGVKSAYIYKPRDEDDEYDDTDRVDSCIDHIRRLDDVSQRHVSFDRFASVVQSEISNPSGTIPGLGSSVLVADAVSVAGCVFQRVHMLGMSEGNYPSTARSDPLLPDYRRVELDPDSSILQTRKEREQISRAHYLYALESASHRRLYWNQAEPGDADIKYPSSWYLDELRKISGNDGISIKVKDVMDPDKGMIYFTPEMHQISNGKLTLGEAYEFDLLLASNASNSQSFRQNLLEQKCFNRLSKGIEYIRAKRSNRFTEYDGNVNGLPHLIEIGTMSASLLQDYATCPYRFFLSQSLNVEELQEPDEELTLSSMDRGTLVHDILEKFVAQRDLSSSDEVQSDLMCDIARQEFTDFRNRNPIGHPTLYRVETSNLLSRLQKWRLIEFNQLGDLPSSHTETRFGFEEHNSNVGLNLQDGSVIKLRGMIDRIALSEDGYTATVLDYKTGGQGSYLDVDKDPVAAGTKLQLAVYMLAARTILPSVKDISAAYWFVFEEGNIKFRPKSFADETDAMSRLHDVAEVIANGIKQGIFPARPGDVNTQTGVSSWENCQFCPYTSVCPSNRPIVWDSKKQAPELNDYIEMAEAPVQ